ncbi:mitotic spindle assembly checkpoint protein MAD2A-like [Nasonia vitripennis]|uniref:HORMA domain-containing protein n=1 Tax=Nasonia vitripennis TaxID=7425 RepID=A0A7M7Q7K6_NASVI|nr:mitotic spindle assembly checkpoint protein MAD2A-like [Nasonia vitripennis]
MVVCEKWVFQIEYESEKTKSKMNRTNIQVEIRAVLRQIITSTNFLPIIDSSHKFKIVFRPSSIQVVAQFPFKIFPYSLTILQSEELSFRKISTSFHTVETKVVYKRLANN